MRIILFVSLLCIALASSSCSSVVVANYDDLSMLRKGMSPSQVDSLFDDDRLKESNTFSIPNSPYMVKNLQVMVQYLQYNETVAGSTATRTRTIIRHNTFRMIFKNNALLSWGFTYDLLNANDPELKKVGEMLRAIREINEREDTQ